MSGAHEEVRILLGAYVLGGLDTAERQAVQDHLSGCRGCRVELAEIAWLPRVLNRLGEASRTDVTGQTPGRAPCAGVLPPAGRGSRRRHR